MLNACYYIDMRGTSPPINPSMRYDYGDKYSPSSPVNLLTNREELNIPTLNDVPLDQDPFGHMDAYIGEVADLPKPDGQWSTNFERECEEFDLVKQYM